MFANSMPPAFASATVPSFAQRQSQVKLQPFFGPSSKLYRSDTLELSPLALERHEFLKMFDTFSVIYKTSGKTGKTRTQTLAEVGQDLQANLADLRNLLGDFLRLAGIDTSREIALQPDGKGHILMAGDHPDKAAIEGLFSDNPTLLGRFMVIAARASILNAAETTPSFRAAYETDARAAIRANVPLLKDRLLSFQLRLHNGEYATSFA